MAKTKRNPQNDSAEEKTEQEKAENNAFVAAEEEQEDDEQSFEELGLDSRLLRALTKKSVEKPTPIQRVAIPLILVCILYIFSAQFAITYFFCYFGCSVCAFCDAGRQRCGGPSENRLRENVSLFASTTSETVC